MKKPVRNSNVGVCLNLYGALKQQQPCALLVVVSNGALKYHCH